MESEKYNKIAIYIFWVLFLNWTLLFVYFSIESNIPRYWFLPISLISMFTPAFAIFFTEKRFNKVLFRNLGLNFTINKWTFFAIALPILLVIMTIPFSLLIPGTSITDGLPFIERQINESEIPYERISYLYELIESLGGWLPFFIIIISIIGSIIVGPTFNTIAALGEELGWRGYLQTSLSEYGFWRSSFFVGFIWGIWHLPLILKGYNYPENPAIGVAMMTLITILLSPIFTFFQQKGNSVLVPAILHGTYNAIAGMPLFFIDGGSSFTTGVTGIAGILVLSVTNITIYIYKNKYEYKN